MSRGELTISGRVDHPGFSLEVDLSVGPGEVVTIVGPNGAGKTTLLRAVAGLAPLSAGTVTIDGVPVDDPEHGRWQPPEKRSAGFVFHDHRLFPRSDAATNVAFGLRARGTRPGPARDQALEWLNRMEAGHLATRSTPNLSAGEAQRVALARALAPRPSVLLLDEPFSALDDPTRRWMRQVLTGHGGGFDAPFTKGRSIGASRLPTRLVVTHDPAEALTLGSRVVVLEHGRVVQDDDPAEIIAHPASAYAAALKRVEPD